MTCQNGGTCVTYYEDYRNVTNVTWVNASDVIRAVAACACQEEFEGEQCEERTKEISNSPLVAKKEFRGGRKGKYFVE